METLRTVMCIAVLSLSGALFSSRDAAAQELRFYLPAAGPGPSSSSKILKLRTGEETLVRVPPLVTINHEDVVSARGVVVPAPVIVDLHAEERPPDQKIYTVVLAFTDRAQEKLQDVVDRYCQSRADLQIALDETILDHIPLLGCGRTFEASVGFWEEDSAQEFAQRFAHGPVRFLEATTRPTRK